METGSIDPNVWGPTFWDLLFYIAINYDNVTQHDNIMQLFSLLESVLPCSDCRRHYSLFKQQIPPIQKIKKKDPSAASVWLWVIHDMVNQNIGKICISYEKLLKKHKSLSCIISDLSIFDSFMFMWFSNSKKEKAKTAIELIILLLDSIHEFKVCKVVKNSITSDWELDKIINCKNEILIFMNFKKQTKDEFIKQYTSSLSF
tara:strand:- start:68 stop:673 length:606 start_codon:yes stop_codon:yes gene_type:complete